MKQIHKRALLGGMMVLLCQCQNVENQADREKFHAADANGDGKLSLAESQNFEHSRVFKLIDYDQNGVVSLQEAKDIAPDFTRAKFDDYDRDRDGKVTFAEYFKVQTAKGTVKQRFNAADTDGDGFVTIKEADARVRFLQDYASGVM